MLYYGSAPVTPNLVQIALRRGKMALDPWPRGNAMSDKSSEDGEGPEPEYWLVRVLKFIGNLIHAAFIHSSPG